MPSQKTPSHQSPQQTDPKKDQPAKIKKRRKVIHNKFNERLFYGN
jgi:hypothetical protein